VKTGIATAVIVRTGKDTAFGEIAQRLASAAGDRIRPRDTPLWADDHASDHAAGAVRPAGERLLHRPVLESFLFSIALAVGMTPEMMP